MIRLGLIGCGMAVQRLHWPALKQLRREITIAAIARRNFQQAKTLAADMGVGRVYQDYHELLNDGSVDAVLTAVPIELNGPVLLDCIRSGKHVMAEKPLAATLDQARLIIQEAPNQNQMVLIGENFRYRRDLLEAKKCIDFGAVGDVFAFHLKVNFDIAASARQPWISRGWRHDARHPGGFILDAGIHPVAALREILGEVDQLWAQVLDTSTVIHGPETLIMQLRMKSGVAGQCFFCYTSKQAKENPLDFTIFGTKGVLRIRPNRIAISHNVGKKPQLLTIKKADGEYVRQWKNFCAAIRGQDEVLSTARKAYGDLAVIDAALQSAASGKPYMVDNEFA